MAVPFATYDLQRPGQDYAGLDEALKKLGWYRALETVWFFEPTATVDQVAAVLGRFTDSNDKWFVGTATGPAQWRNLGDKWTAWLKKNL